jgi:hypothetical protein
VLSKSSKAQQFRFILQALPASCASVASAAARTCRVLATAFHSAIAYVAAAASIYVIIFHHNMYSREPQQVTVLSAEEVFNFAAILSE